MVSSSLFYLFYLFFLGLQTPKFGPRSRTGAQWPLLRQMLIFQPWQKLGKPHWLHIFFL